MKIYFYKINCKNENLFKKKIIVTMKIYFYKINCKNENLFLKNLTVVMKIYFFKLIVTIKIYLKKKL